LTKNNLTIILILEIMKKLKDFKNKEVVFKNINGGWNFVRT